VVLVTVVGSGPWCSTSDASVTSPPLRVSMSMTTRPERRPVTMPTPPAAKSDARPWMASALALARSGHL
jgi:hypothetical protein